MKTLYIVAALIGVATLLSLAAYLLRKLPSASLSTSRRLSQWLLITAALSLLPVVIAGGMWAWHHWHNDNTQNSTPALRTQIHFFAPETSVTRVVTPFRVGNGYAVVGCDETNTQRVTYEAPAGATIDVATAAWVNTDGVADQSASASHNSHTATGVGAIRGRNRDLFGCRGVGHGELVLSGTFSSDQRSKTGRDVLIKSVEERLEEGSIAGVTLPDGNPPEMGIQIMFPDDPTLGTISAAISRDEAGQYTLTTKGACKCGVYLALASNGSLLVHRQDTNPKLRTAP